MILLTTGSALLAVAAFALALVSFILAIVSWRRERRRPAPKLISWRALPSGEIELIADNGRKWRGKVGDDLK